MRIGLFIDTETMGGAEHLVVAVARQFKEAGHVPIVYCFENEYLERALSSVGVERRALSARFWYKKSIRLPVFAWRMAAQLRADRIDVLHSHLFGPIIAGALASRLAGVPHVATLHDVYIVQERPALRGRMLRFAHFLGTSLVCVSEEMALAYEDMSRIPRSELIVILNGIALERYQAVPRGERQFGRVRLLMVGRLDPIKRHDLLLDALATLRDRDDWQADIVGSGPTRAALEANSAALGLSERVSFWGSRDDVPERLRDADIFLLISDSEGMSLSLIEALASGLPVVATRVGNNEDLVTDGWNGLLIPRGDSVALRRSIEKLLDDRGLRLDFGRRSAERSRGFGLDRTVRAYLGLYESRITRTV